MNCSASPYPCSTYSRMPRPSSGEPSHCGPGARSQPPDDWRHAAVAAGFGQCGLNRQRLVEAAERFVVLALGHAQNAQAAMRLGVIGAEAQGLEVAPPRLLPLAQLEQRAAEIKMARRVAGIEVDGP